MSPRDEGNGAMRALIQKLNDKGMSRSMPVDEIREISIDEQARTVEFAFSSEAPVDRWFGMEILDHKESSVRLERLRAAGPLLSEHWGRQIGVVESVWFKEQRLWVRVRFSKNQLGSEELLDVVDGIRRNVSFRYLVWDMALESETDEVRTYRVTDWEPTHVALVAEPADITVGIGRSLNESTAEGSAEEKTMSKPIDNAADNAVNESAIRKAAEEKALVTVKANFEARVKSIMELRGKFEDPALKEIASGIVDRALTEGWDLSTTQAELLRAIAERKPESKPAARVTESFDIQPDNDARIGMSARDIERYSILRAMTAMVALAEGKGESHEDVKAAGFEFEVSRAAAEHGGINPKGIVIPYDLMAHRRRRDLGNQMVQRAYERAMATTSTAAGGALVPTVLDQANFIDLLVAVTRVLGMATVIPGLNGELDMPRKATNPTFYHVDYSSDETTNITAESSPTTGLVSFRSKTVGCYSDITRKMMKNAGNFALDAMVEDALFTSIALGMEFGSINGSGSSGEPTGIISQANVGSVAGVAAAEYLHGLMVDLKTAVRNENADMSRNAFVTNPDVQGLLEQTEKGATNGQYIWVDGEQGGRVTGRKAFATTLVPNDLGGNNDESAIIYGNWADLAVPMWGGIDLTIDRTTLGRAGGTRFITLQDYDVQCLRPTSFAVTQIDVGNDF